MFDGIQNQATTLHRWCAATDLRLFLSEKYYVVVHLLRDPCWLELLRGTRSRAPRCGDRLDHRGTEWPRSTASESRSS